MTHFSIKDVEALTGIKPHTLRIWEQRYGIPQPRRTSTNIRFYSDEDIKLLLNVAMLNRQGHKISRITKMSREEMDHLVLELTNNTSDKLIQIETLTGAMFGLDEIAFETILSNNIFQIGLERTYLEIIFPFLLKVGVLWQTGAINPSYEHFITNLIRQKLFVACDIQPKNKSTWSKKFLLFLPSNEPHEIGLLFANYLLRSRGHHTCYFGTNLPIDDLSSVMQIYKADYILTVLTTSIVHQGPLQVANKLAGDFPETSVLISGPQVVKANIQLPKNVRFIYTMQELIEMLELFRGN